MKFPIKNRFTGNPITEVELDASYESAAYSVQLGAAVKIAAAENTNLACADLAGVDLSGADLARAYLVYADLVRANLSGANLVRANLSCADLAGVDLSGALLVDADLAGANLSGANLVRANLSGANLTRVNLAVVDLGKKGILQINGLRWPILITPEYMRIGCEKHLHGDWRSFDDRRIAEMDGKEALKFWRDNKDWLLERCEWAAGFKKDGV